MKRVHHHMSPPHYLLVQCILVEVEDVVEAMDLAEAVVPVLVQEHERSSEACSHYNTLRQSEPNCWTKYLKKLLNSQKGLIRRRRPKLAVVQVMAKMTICLTLIRLLKHILARWYDSRILTLEPRTICLSAESATCKISIQQIVRPPLH